MPTDKLRKKQKELSNLLKELSEINSTISNEEAVERFKNIYSDEFRHLYSSLNPTLKVLHESDKIRSLVAKISDIIKFIDENENRNAIFVPKIVKLYDHINLELIQFDTQKSLSSELLKTKEEYKKTKEEYEKSKKEYEKAQTQVITILSIFSAIVIAFTGGLSLMSSAFTAIQNSPMVKIIVLVLTAGGMLYNCIFLLLYYIAKITDKNIYSYCRTNKSRCDGTCDKKCGLFIRTYRKMPMLFYVNIAILLGIVICIFYQIGVVNNWYINLFAK